MRAITPPIRTNIPITVCMVSAPITIAHIAPFLVVLGFSIFLEALRIRNPMAKNIIGIIKNISIRFTGALWYAAAATITIIRRIDINPASARVIIPAIFVRSAPVSLFMLYEKHCYL
jgi:hypothetical protein